MDRSWMQLDKTNPSFVEGVEEFIKFAYLRKQPNEKIPCPCYDCNNFRDQTQEVVRYHLSIRGMTRSYIRWLHHGEPYEDDSNNEGNIEGNVDIGYSEDDSSDNEMFEMLNDISNAYLGETSETEENLTNPGAPYPLGRVDSFLKLLEDSTEKLNKGCESYSKLSFLVKLLHIKTTSGWTNKSFDMLFELLKDVFQGVDLDLPKSYNESKKIMRDLGFKYKKIHSCPNDCALFWKEYENFDDCPKSNTCRWKYEGSKRIPQKVLRYFPLKPRLRRLFVNKDLARHMRWHKEEMVHEENALRHPADSEAWQDFDKRIHYSPVIPEMLGLKGPGKDIDVYLRPLIHELKELWETGIEAYDAYKEKGLFYMLH